MEGKHKSQKCVRKSFHSSMTQTESNLATHVQVILLNCMSNSSIFRISHMRCVSRPDSKRWLSMQRTVGLMSSALRHLKGISEHLEAIRGVKYPRHLLSQLEIYFWIWRMLGWIFSKLGQEVMPVTLC